MATTVTTVTRLEFILSLTSSDGSAISTRKLTIDNPNTASETFQQDVVAIANLLKSDTAMFTPTGDVSEFGIPKWNQLVQPTSWRDSLTDLDTTNVAPYTCTAVDYQVVSTQTTKWTED